MRNTSLLLFSLLLAIYAANFHLCSAAPEPVVVGTEKLRARVSYHIVESDINGNMIGGHGIYSFLRDDTTPFPPIEVIEGSLGLPVFFSPVNPKKSVLRVSTDLNVIFWDTTNVWKIHKENGQYFVTTGGIIGNPGPKTFSNWFKLEKYGNAYKFMYCPSVCRSCKFICKDVGVFVKDGKRLLALTDDQPLLVTFIEHDD